MSLLAAAVLLVAFDNGSNDNSKGVATLFGAGPTRLWPAIEFAAVATLLGSATAVLFAEELLKAFPGKGLVPSSPASSAS